MNILKITSNQHGKVIILGFKEETSRATAKLCLNICQCMFPKKISPVPSSPLLSSPLSGWGFSKHLKSPKTTEIMQSYVVVGSCKNTSFHLFRRLKQLESWFFFLHMWKKNCFNTPKTNSSHMFVYLDTLRDHFPCLGQTDWLWYKCLKSSHLVGSYKLSAKFKTKCKLGVYSAFCCNRDTT